MALPHNRKFQHNNLYVVLIFTLAGADFMQATLNLSHNTKDESANGASERIAQPPTKTQSTDADSCREITAEYLLQALSSLWADKSNKDKIQILEDCAFKGSHIPSFSFLGMPIHDRPKSLKEQLPDKAVATGWLTTFLRGPNMLTCICDEAESWNLLDAIYTAEDMNNQSRCSIWLQLAVGCRYTTGTTENTIADLYESGCQYMEWCIEQSEEVAPPWIMPLMLLSCLYSMRSKPKTCWVTLGKFSSYFSKSGPAQERFGFLGWP